MIVNNYDEARELFQKTLKENENAARRELRAIKKLANQNPEILACNEEIRKIQESLESQKSIFVEKFMSVYKDLFFADKSFMDSFVVETLEGYLVGRSVFDVFKPYFSDTNKPSFEEAFSFIETAFERNSFFASMYLRIEVLRAVIERFSLTNEEVKNDVTSELNSSFSNNERMEKIGTLSECTKLELVLNELTKKLDKNEKAFTQLQNLTIPSKNETYHFLKVYESVLNSWVKHRKQLFENLVESSSDYELVKTLRSDSLKQASLTSIFSPDLVDELAEDPEFLINLGKASVTKAKKTIDNKITNYLVDEYTKPNNDATK